MSENNSTKPKKNFSADWFVGGILTKIGQTFDRLTGRNWKPSSSLATSELIERLKKMLDSEAKDFGEKGKFVPHNLKLKMQWNKFSTDAEGILKKLEYEMLAAAIDHINDNRYHTYKPLKIEIKPDYFTEGVKFLASFGEFDEEKDAVVDITVPQMRVENLIPEPIKNEPDGENYIAEFTVNDKQKSVELKFLPGKRVGVGRTKENDLSIEDASISKVHAALVLNSENQLMVADTGSTNGTFINGQRIAYGRAFPIGESDKLKFGTVEVFMRLVPKQTDFETSQSYTMDIASTQNFETSQNQLTQQEFQNDLNQPKIQDIDSNPDSDTPKKPTEIQPLNNNYQNFETTPQTVNEMVSKAYTDTSIPVPQPAETKSTIPVPQPNETFQEKNDVNPYETKIENKTPESKEFAADDENQSQVFNTEPRVNFNFEDDEQK
jgi:pSer/pThr/pTyr-binding forkhead associated (FHA) protein